MISNLNELKHRGGYPTAEIIQTGDIRLLEVSAPKAHNVTHTDGEVMVDSEAEMRMIMARQ